MGDDAQPQSEHGGDGLISDVIAIHNAEVLARRKAWRDAIRAIEAIPQANRGSHILIRRKDAIAAIQHLTPNGIGWGSIHLEKGDEPK